MVGGMKKMIPLYFKYTKPKVWSLLVFVGAVGAVLAIDRSSSSDWFFVLLAVISLSAGAAGSESVTNVIDRDIDAKMARTRNRPLVTGNILPKNGLIFGLFLIVMSVFLLTLYGKFLAASFISVGIADNVVVYSLLLKRRTPWSVILGGFSGGFPVLVGWYTVTSSFSILPWFLFALVVVWIPVHIWSLAYRYRGDYEKAGIPMLPVVYSDKISAACISFSAILLVVFSIIPYFLGENSTTYILVVAVLSAPLLIFAALFMKERNNKSSFNLFKYSSPYLAIVFTLFMILKFV
ncbi:MAG: heme o synthase [Candidatus Thermoplasmatota archaeon]|nr:heme o synthase [Candidatus Thermoplasmatota archaeon]